MRRGTRIAIIGLFLVLFAATAVQVYIATRERDLYPGPVAGTPFPTTSTR